MSVDVIARVLQHSRAKGSARAVLLVLAEHINATDPERGCWPSVGRIAERAGLSRRQAQRRLRELEGMGEIRREWEKGCRRRCPTYHVTLSDEAMQEAASPDGHVTLRKSAPYGDNGVTLSGGHIDRASNPPTMTQMSPRGDLDDTPLRVTRMSPPPYGDAGVTRTGIDLEPESNRNLSGSVETEARASGAASEDQGPVAKERTQKPKPDRSLPDWEEAARYLLETGQLPNTRYWRRAAYGTDAP